MPTQLLKHVSRVFLALAAFILASCGGGGGGTGATPAPAPSISSFTVQPSGIGVGGSAQLSASFSNGTGRIEPGNLAITSGSSVTVSPATTTTYVLTVTGAGGTNTSQAQVLTVHPAPTITAFTAAPSAITAGGTAQLTAQFAGGSGVLTPGGTNVTSGVAVPVTPLETTQYTLTVTPPAGAAVTRTLAVQVVPPASIATFAANPASIRQGGSSQLSFTFSGGAGVVSPGNHAVTSGGTLSVSPMATTTYTLVVTNSLGTPSSAQTMVNVVPLPVLTSTAPAVVSAGQNLSFRVSGVDESGNPLGPFVLDHGPYGMTVSSSGEVAWPTDLPMFDRAMDVRWQVSVPSYPGVRLAGTIRVEDANRGYCLRRFGTEIPIWNSGLVVADFNKDGRADMLIASRFGLAILQRSETTCSMEWAYPFKTTGTAGIGAVAARDLDGDGRPEILFGDGHMLVKLDGLYRRETARFTGTSGRSIVDIKVADLDRNGSQEVICLEVTSSYSGTGRIIILDATTLSERWHSADLNLGASIAIGNVDGDPAFEIVTASGLVIDGQSLQTEWSYNPGFGRAVATGDLDGNGTEEIVGMQDWNTCKGFDAVLKSPIWEHPGFDFDALLVQDVDGDGIAEIFLGDGQWGNVTGYKYVKSSNGLSQIFKQNSQDHGVTSMGVGDVDGDGVKEIIWGSGATSSGSDVLVVAGLGPGSAIEWNNHDPEQLDGPFIGGQLAKLSDGTRRLMFAVPSTDSGYNGTRLVAMDPNGGSIQVSKELGTNWSHKATLQVQDFTGTGVDRALLSSSKYYDGYLTAYEFSSGWTDWTSEMGLGTTVASATADLNGDGYADLVTITSEGYVYVHDIRNQARIWKSTGMGTGIDVGTADLDGDGVPEIVALTSPRVVALRRSSPSGPFLETTSFAVTDGRDMVIGDLSGSGKPEVFLLAGPSYPGSNRVITLDSSLSLVGTATLPVAGQTLHIENLGAGRKNLLLGVDGTTTEAPHMRAIAPRTGAEIWKSPGFFGNLQRHSLHFADVSGDLRKEMAFGTTQGMYLTR